MREHDTKTTPVLLPADGEASWSLLPSSVSLLSGGTVQPENTYSCILKVTGQVWESQKLGKTDLKNITIFDVLGWAFCSKTDLKNITIFDVLGPSFGFFFDPSCLSVQA